MRIKIISDGRYIGTRIQNAETGEFIDQNVTLVGWECVPPDEPRAILEFRNVELEVVTEWRGDPEEMRENFENLRLLGSGQAAEGES